MGKALKKIDFPAYAKMLGALLPHLNFFGVVDATGKSVWVSSDLARKPVDAAAADFARARADWMEEKRGVIRKSPVLDLTIAGQGLVGSSGEAYGALILFARDLSGQTGPDQRLALAACLRSVCNCMLREYQLCAELDTMAAELSERYEELNLLYNTDDHVRYYDEAEQALEQAVRNTALYLDVGMTVLILPAKNVLLSHVNDACPPADPDLIVEILSGDICERLCADPETLVINNEQDTCVGLSFSQLGSKLLCRPVVGPNGEAEGIFAIVNGPDAPDFTNNDSNLLQVMTRKITRIVLASYDPLTGLLARPGYEHFLEKSLASSRYAQNEHCVLHVNIDKLHLVNDTGSPHAGDALIREVAQVIAEQLRDSDIVARLGGDEFGLILAECSLETGRDIAEKIRKSIEAMQFAWDRREYSTTVSIGVAPLRPESENINEVMSAAEIACGEAKDNGRNRVTALRRDDTQLIRREAQMQWVGRIHEALRDDLFVLYSQPIAPLQEGLTLHHSEILLRLADKDGQILAPGEFLPSAERYNLMPAIDRWVVGHAFRQIGEFQRKIAQSEIADDRSFMWSINLSGQTMGDRRFLNELLAMAEEFAVAPRAICFEVTETAAVNNLSDARRFIAALKARGFRFSLDDFGTGVSSFTYLKALPVDYLKIDGSFVCEVTIDPVSDAMVCAVNQIGHVMGLRTIAEFVETEEIRARLVEIGLDYAQGFAIAQPGPLADELLALAVAPEVIAL